MAAPAQLTIVPNLSRLMFPGGNGGNGGIADAVAQGAMLDQSAPMQLWQKSAADGTAATATAEQHIGCLGPNGVGYYIGAVTFGPSAALTASDTNYATISVYKRTVALPGTQVLIASCTTALTVGTFTGNWTAWLGVPLTVVASAFLSPGDTVTVVITKTGTGVVVPQGQLAIYAN